MTHPMIGDYAVTASAFGPPPQGPNPTWTSSPFESDLWTIEDFDRTWLTIDFRTIPVPMRFTAKYLLWALEYVTDSRLDRFKVRSPRTFYLYFCEFRYLANYAAAKGYVSLLRFSEDDVYASLLERLAESADPAGGISRATFKRVHSLYEKLFLLGPCEIGAVPDGLPLQPIRKKLQRPYFLREDGHTALMPDHVATEFYLRAMEYLELGKSITFLCELDLKVRRMCKDLNSSSRLEQLMFGLNKRNELLGDPIIRQRVDSALEQLGPYRKHLDLSMTIDCREHDYARFHAKTLWRVTRHLIAACFVVIAGFTGFRYREVASIRVGGVKLRGARAIVTTRLTKTIKVSGGADVDRFGPPVVAQAYEVMERLSRVLRPSSNFIWCAADGGAADRCYISDVLNDFAQHIASRDWHVTTHQFRKYFSIFYYSRFKGGAEALRYQFRHITHAMIETYIRDTNAAESLMFGKRHLAREIFYDLAYGEGVYSANAKTLPESAMLTYRAANLPLAQIGERLEKLCANSFTEVRPTPWGYCVVQQHDTSGARCAVDGSPDPGRMFPENCAKCRHLVRERSNDPFWQHTLELHRSIADDNRSPQLAREASRSVVEEVTRLLAAAKSRKDQ